MSAKILPTYTGDVEDRKESLLYTLARVFRKLWGPIFALALMINIIILYIKITPRRPLPRALTNIHTASAPRDLPFTTPTLTQNGVVPMIIHQSWKNSEVPARFKRWQDQWKQLHPDWQYHLWTDEDNRELVKQHYPWFLNAYDSFPINIMRADSIRYLYMYHYGGVYADLDMEPLQKTELLLESLNLNNETKDTAILGYMGSAYHYEHNVPNAWMMSTPKHPFWMFCLLKIIELGAAGVNSAETLTGPVMLFQVISDYNEAMRRVTGRIEPGVEVGATSIFDLKIMKPGLIYPYDWYTMTDLKNICWAKDDSTLNEQQCKSKFPNAFTITYWTHSWE